MLRAFDCWNAWQFVFPQNMQWTDHGLVENVNWRRREQKAGKIPACYGLMKNWRCRLLSSTPLVLLWMIHIRTLQETSGDMKPYRHRLLLIRKIDLICLFIINYTQAGRHIFMFCSKSVEFFSNLTSAFQGLKTKSHIMSFCFSNQYRHGVIG